MKIIQIKRNTIYKKQYSIIMGELVTKITYIQKYLFGLPIQTLYKHKESYYGYLKDSKEGMLFI